PCWPGPASSRGNARDAQWDAWVRTWLRCQGLHGRLSETIRIRPVPAALPASRHLPRKPQFRPPIARRRTASATGLRSRAVSYGGRIRRGMGVQKNARPQGFFLDARENCLDFLLILAPLVPIR